MAIGLQSNPDGVSVTERREAASGPAPDNSVGTSATALAALTGADDLKAIEALDATAGLLVKTGANAYARRTITGDTEIVVTNGSGASGNPTLSIGPGIARDAEIAAAYQPLDSDLTAIAALSTTSYGRALLTLANSAAAQSAIGVREVLTADRTYYVRTDGSDSNNGLTNSSGGAFLTIQAAVDACQTIDAAGFNVTVQVVAGTYGAGFTVSKSILGCANFAVTGDTTTPSNVVIAVSSGTNISITAGWNSPVRLGGFSLTNSGGGNVSVSAGNLLINGKMVYSSVAGQTIMVVQNAAFMRITADFEIASSASRFLLCQQGGIVQIDDSKTITVTGTPAWGTAFVTVVHSGSTLRWRSATFSGSATGTRYGVTLNAVVDTAGGGANYFPGNGAGSTATGGQYA